MSLLYIGFMSGTSFDGLDASLVCTDGINKFTPLRNLHIAYPEKLKQNIVNSYRDIKSLLLCEQHITELHIKATHQILKEEKLSSKDIKSLAMHGQTIFHDPVNRLTFQIGNPHLLAKKTGIDVIHDFRRADISKGGQGAPIVPIFHEFLVRNHAFPIAIVNIGGVANLTYVDNNNLIAFDTGTGNALIDDAMKKYFNKSFDDNGEIASKGKIDRVLINKFMSDKYFTQEYPKSLDRNAFNKLITLLSEYKYEDIVANLTYFTSASIVHAINSLPKEPKQIFLCGGGSKNKMISRFIKNLVSEQNILVSNISEIDDLDPDYIESQALAYLAARFYKNLPSTFPSTTNVEEPSICGCLVRSI